MDAASATTSRPSRGRRAPALSHFEVATRARAVSLRRAALSGPTGTLYFRHCHVFRAHHHRDSTSERVGGKLVYGVAPRGASFLANDVVLELQSRASTPLGGLRPPMTLVRDCKSIPRRVRTPTSGVARVGDNGGKRLRRSIRRRPGSSRSRTGAMRVRMISASRPSAVTKLNTRSVVATSRRAKPIRSAS